MKAMQEVEIPLPPDIPLSKVTTIIESCCIGEELWQTLKGTLKQYPGSVHWHYKRGKESGTLEITYWPERRRIWFKVSPGRRGGWIEETIQRLSANIPAELRKKKRRPAKSPLQQIPDQD
jgi:hypothetical protein